MKSSGAIFLCLSFVQVHSKEQSFPGDEFQRSSAAVEAQGGEQIEKSPFHLKSTVSAKKATKAATHLENRVANAAAEIVMTSNGHTGMGAKSRRLTASPDKVDCSQTPVSVNSPSVSSVGCAGARWKGGSYAREYCENANSSVHPTYQWYMQCCEWQENECVPKAFCINGIQNGEVCCDSSCESCGGADCSRNAAGSERCCEQYIIWNSRICASFDDVVCLVPSSDPSPLGPRRVTIILGMVSVFVCALCLGIRMPQKKVIAITLLPAVILTAHGAWRLNWSECGFTWHVAEWEHNAVWLFALIVVALIVVTIIISMRRKSSDWNRVTWLDWYKQVATTIRWLFLNRKPRLLYEEHQQLRLNFVRRVASVAKNVVVFGFLICCWMLYAVVHKEWGWGVRFIEADFHQGSDWALFTLCSIVLLIFDLTRPWWTTAYLDACNIMLSSVCVWRFCTIQASYHHQWGYSSMTIRVIQGICCGNPHLSILLQIMVTFVDVFTGYQKCSVRIQAYSIVQLQSLLVLCSIYLCFDSMTSFAAEAIVEARQSSNANVAAHRLLAGMCDAVLSLDSDLNIALPCPKLAGLLMRPSVGVPGATRSFLEFMPSVDQVRFVAFLNDEAKAQAAPPANVADALPARVLHVTLYDAHHTPVQVELFSSFIGDGRGGPCHLVGIITTAVDSEIPFSDMQLMSTESKPLTKQPICENTISAPSEETSSFITLCKELQEKIVGDESTTSFVIDTLTSDFDIIQCSSSFANLGGASSLDRKFSEWFPDSNGWTRFVHFIECIIKEAACKGDAQTATLEGVVLCPPNLERKICIDCSCSAIFEERDPFEDEAGYVKLLCSNMTVRIARQTPKHRTRVLDRNRKLQALSKFVLQKKSTERVRREVADKAVTKLVL